MPDYLDNNYIPVNKTFEWFQTLSDIVNALIAHGLVNDFFNEHDVSSHRQPPDMVRGEDGWWRLAMQGRRLPLTFSLKARKLFALDRPLSRA